MDQLKTGKLIASCRKEQGMTQAVLAENHALHEMSRMRQTMPAEKGAERRKTGIIIRLRAGK